MINTEAVRQLLHHLADELHATVTVENPWYAMSQDYGCVRTSPQSLGQFLYQQKNVYPSSCYVFNDKDPALAMTLFCEWPKQVNGHLLESLFYDRSLERSVRGYCLKRLNDGLQLVILELLLPSLHC